MLTTVTYDESKAFAEQEALADSRMVFSEPDYDVLSRQLHLFFPEFAGLDLTSYPDLIPGTWMRMYCDRGDGVWELCLADVLAHRFEIYACAYSAAANRRRKEIWDFLSFGQPEPDEPNTCQLKLSETWRIWDRCFSTMGWTKQ